MWKKRKITEKQLVYLNILLNNAFGENRKLYLKLNYEIDSSKDLDFDQAHEIIEKFIPENPEMEKNVDISLRKIKGEKKDEVVAKYLSIIKTEIKGRNDELKEKFKNTDEVKKEIEEAKKAKEKIDAIIDKNKED